MSLCDSDQGDALRALHVRIEVNRLGGANAGIEDQGAEVKLATPFGKKKTSSPAAIQRRNRKEYLLEPRDLFFLVVGHGFRQPRLDLRNASLVTRVGG